MVNRPGLMEISNSSTLNSTLPTQDFISEGLLVQNKHLKSYSTIK